jgi:hypothetical protein
MGDCVRSRDESIHTPLDPTLFWLDNIFKYRVRSPKFIWAPVYSCTHWLRPRNSPPPDPIWAHIRGRYWSGKIDDISL